MTERDWTKAGIYIPDPGAVREVRDTGGVFCGNDAHPFKTKSQQRKEMAEKARKRRRKAKKRAAKLK